MVKASKILCHLDCGVTKKRHFPKYKCVARPLYYVTWLCFSAVNLSSLILLLLLILCDCNSPTNPILHPGDCMLHKVKAPTRKMSATWCRFCFHLFLTNILELSIAKERNKTHAEQMVNQPNGLGLGVEDFGLRVFRIRFRVRVGDWGEGYG